VSEVSKSELPAEPNKFCAWLVRGPRVIGGWRGLGWIALGAIPAGVLMWLIVFSRMEGGSKADWFAAIGCA
jgi:hypothetical protein